MDYLDALEIIIYIYNQRTNDILLQRWITNYETEMSFDEFKKQLGISENSIKPKTNKKSNVKEIVNILSDLKDKFG